MCSCCLGENKGQGGPLTSVQVLVCMQILASERAWQAIKPPSSPTINGMLRTQKDPHPSRPERKAIRIVTAADLELLSLIPWQPC